MVFVCNLTGALGAVLPIYLSNISERSNISKLQSRSFEDLWDFTIRYLVGKRSIPQVLCVMGNNSVQRRNVIHFLKCNTSNNNRQILFGALLKCPPPTKTKTIYSHLSPRVEMLTEKDACFQASLYNFSTSQLFCVENLPHFTPPLFSPLLMKS